MSTMNTNTNINVQDYLRCLFPEFHEFDQYMPDMLDSIANNNLRNGETPLHRLHIFSRHNVDRKILTPRLKKMVREVLCCAYVLKKETITPSETLSEAELALLMRSDDSYQRANGNFDGDQEYLRNFHKYMNIFLELTPPGERQKVKTLAVQVCGRLDGYGTVYIPGSRQRDAVTRREAIYHKLAHVVKKSRSPRRRRDSDESDPDDSETDSERFSVSSDSSQSDSASRVVQYHQPKRSSKKCRQIEVPISDKEDLLQIGLSFFYSDDLSLPQSPEDLRMPPSLPGFTANQLEFNASCFDNLESYESCFDSLGLDLINGLFAF